jgi:hypothetical protein
MWGWRTQDADRPQGLGGRADTRWSDRLIGPGVRQDHLNPLLLRVGDTALTSTSDVYFETTGLSTVDLTTTNRLLALDTTRTAQTTTRPSIISLFRVYSSPP